MKFDTSMTTDTQLYEMANLAGIKLEPILFKDELNKVRKINTSNKRTTSNKWPHPIHKNYIINLGTTTTGGTHWVALYLSMSPSRKVAYYFNSFSDEFNNNQDIPIEIYEFMKRQGISSYYYNTKSIQDPKLGYCGQFSLDFLIHMNDNKRTELESYNAFLRKFKNKDPIIAKYIEKHPDSMTD